MGQSSGRALSQPFMAAMWLIRKIGVRRNIADTVMGIRWLTTENVLKVFRVP